MKTVLLVLAALVGIVVLFFVWRVVATVRASNRRTLKILEEINPVLDALRQDLEPAAEDVLRFAESPRTRNVLYDSLHAQNREDLFPKQFLNHDSFAESDMVFWLCHPNELGRAPDEIELMAKVSKDAGEPTGWVEYFVYRYRTKSPHWASEDGWLAGVSGPIQPDLPPSTLRPGTFSRFEPFDSQSAEEHAEHSHQILTQRGGYQALVGETEETGDD